MVRVKSQCYLILFPHPGCNKHFDRPQFYYQVSLQLYEYHPLDRLITPMEFCQNKKLIAQDCCPKSNFSTIAIQYSSVNLVRAPLAASRILPAKSVRTDCIVMGEMARIGILSLLTASWLVAHKNRDHSLTSLWATLTMNNNKRERSTDHFVLNNLPGFFSM